MVRRTCAASVVLSSLLSLTAVAQLTPDTSRVLQLPDLLAEVQASNPSLRAARLEADALATRRAQVTALPDPTASLSYRPFAVGGVDGLAPARVTLQQMIPFPGKLRLAGEAAGYGAEMTALEADELLLGLAYEVKESYYELYRIQEQDRLIQHFQEQLDDFEQVATVRYEVGTGAQQAILKAQLERNKLARQRLDLAAMRRMHVERLARLVNRPDLAAKQGLFTLERPALDLADDVRPEEALRARPDVQAIEAGLNMADAEIEMAKKEYLPDFMIGAGFMDMMGPGGAAMPLDNLGNRFGLEFGVVIPLQRSKRGAALEEARLRRRQLEARYEAVQTEIKTEFNDLQNRLAEDEKALVLYRQTLIPQAETTLEATLSAYTTGRTDFLDLLDAERMLFDLRMDYEETYADYLRTQAQLERTLGIASDDFRFSIW